MLCFIQRSQIVPASRSADSAATSAQSIGGLGGCAILGARVSGLSRYVAAELTLDSRVAWAFHTVQQMITVQLVRIAEMPLRLRQFIVARLLVALIAIAVCRMVLSIVHIEKRLTDRNSIIFGTSRRVHDRLPLM